MKLYNDILNQMEDLRKTIGKMKIKRFFMPEYVIQDNVGHFHKKNNFAALGLENGGVGFCFVRYLTKYQIENLQNMEKIIEGSSPFDYINGLGSEDEIDHFLALICVNAISQAYIREKNITLDFTTDSLGALEIKPNDIIGMIGFFKTLVPEIKSNNSKLIIIEKRSELVQNHSNWEVTLDISKLSKCNKIICTASTLINKSLENVLSYCENSEFFTLIGPSAGLLPDQLFKRGITVVGSTFAQNFEKLFQCLEENIDWRPAVHKYCFSSNDYDFI